MRTFNLFGKKWTVQTEDELKQELKSTLIEVESGIHVVRENVSKQITFFEKEKISFLDQHVHDWDMETLLKAETKLRVLRDKIEDL